MRKKNCHLYGEKMKHLNLIVRVSFDYKRSSEKKVITTSISAKKKKSLINEIK